MRPMILANLYNPSPHALVLFLFSRECFRVCYGWLQWLFSATWISQISQKKIETSFFIVTIGWQWAIHSRHSARHETEPQSDNSDTSNASIASASGSIGYGGSRVPANSICYQSSTEGPSPGDTAVSPQGKEPAGLLVATTSGSALIGLSDSDGGCINPAYDNGDGNCPTGTNDGIVVDAGEGPGAATCGESTTSSTSNENSNQTCCLSSPSFPKSKSLSTTASLKKKSSSFLHRERKKPVLTRSQVSCSFLWKLFLWFYLLWVFWICSFWNFFDFFSCDWV